MTTEESSTPRVEDFYTPPTFQTWGPVKAWIASAPIGEVVQFPEHVSTARRSGIANLIKQTAQRNGIARSRVKVLRRDEQTWVYIEPETK